jgi:S1-C subfamily serine protease
MIGILFAKTVLVVFALTFHITSVEAPLDHYSNWAVQSETGPHEQQGNSGYQLVAVDQEQSKPPTANAYPSGDQASQQVADASEFWVVSGHRMKVTDALLVLFTGLLVIFTGGLIIVGYMQNRTNKRQNRAFLAVEGASVTDEGVTWGPNGAVINDNSFRNISAPIKVKNSGNTPAYKVRHVASVEIKKMTDEHGIKAPTSLGKKFMTTIPPGGIITKVAKATARMTTDELEALRAGTSGIFLCGTIHYEDAFRKPHFTNYKMVWGANYPFHPDSGGIFCEDGNDAD